MSFCKPNPLSITAAYADEDVNTAASMAEEAVRWNGLYDKPTSHSKPLKNLSKIYGDDIGDIQRKLDSGELVLDKTLADYIYQINTNKELVINMTLPRDVVVIITGKEDGWRDNRSVPGEEVNDARIAFTNYAEWAVLGQVVVSRKKNNRNAAEYRLVHDVYDFDIKSGIRNISRNLETILGSPGPGVGYKIVIKNQNRIKFVQ
ncbi:hypothetical protein [Moraxella oculi]|uniref:Uncharacterized protein n=1 Tax=Moraxella oculi TaxID=2940516 RepID=A0ABW8UAU9_9GAMM